MPGELQALGHIRLVIPDRIGHRIRDYDQRRAVDNGVDGRYKMAEQFEVTITDSSLTVERRQARIDEEARLDGIYVIRTPVTAKGFAAADTVTATRT